MTMTTEAAPVAVRTTVAAGTVEAAASRHPN